MAHVCRLALGLVALDSLLAGLWLLARPGWLLAFLGGGPSADALLLFRGLGALLVGQAGCLAAAAWRPFAWRGLVMAPALGRALQVGLALALLGTDRARLPPRSLHLLIAHDGAALAVLLAVAAAFLARSAPKH